MDLSLVSTIIQGVFAALLAINLFFIRNLIVEIKAASISGITNAVKIEMLQKQMEDISHMREDVAGLKYAIMGYIRKTET